MINIIDKHNCCGCSSCVQACPKRCISFEEDNEGFRYPTVDTDSCISCGLCEKVCPVINQAEEKKPQKILAAKNIDEDIRLQSSSGGIFSLLAEKIIAEGGVVFGVRFDENWEAVHDYTDTIDGICAFRGSKYMQSRIGNSFIDARKFLNTGRKVLFTGTPCQIAALKLFLRKDYENLLTVDVACHGVPSPGVWRNYLASVSYIDRHRILSVNFRNKSNGWKNYSLKINDYEHNEFEESFRTNIYFIGFLKDIYLRPACYTCPAKFGKSHSDITIADYWGIEKFYPKFDDNKGIGLVLVNTNKGNGILQHLNIDCIETTFEQAIYQNSALIRSSKEPKQRAEFWQLYSEEGINAIMPICNKMKPSLTNRIYRKTLRIIKNFIGK